MKTIFQFTGILAVSSFLVGCDGLRQLEQTAEYYNNLEDQVIALNMKAQAREAEIMRLQHQIRSLENHNKYLEVQLEKEGKRSVGREIASIAHELPQGAEDHVKFHVYNWSADQMLAIAQDEFQKKNYAKAAQYYKAIAVHYPKESRAQTDQFLFQAGIAAYESGKHQDWVDQHLGKLLQEHPTSKYYRGAKLWLGLNHLKKGNTEKFFETVEEFRKKYRNTPEWTILSAHYEKIVQKYKP